MSVVPRRRRAAAVSTSLAVLATTVLAVGGASLSGSPATAAPAEDCTEAFPVTALSADDPVDGLTVSRGTEPDPFTGEVLGVLDDGIAPGVDMVLARLTSPEIDRVGGIWQGMSGSPVYAADGRLIGAVAYGLAWGASPVAGITPFDQMDDYLGSAAPQTRVRVDGRTAAKIAADTDVTARQASEGLTQLPMPLGVSGVSAKRLAQVDRASDQHSYLAGDLTAVGSRGASAAASADDVTAGGNLAAALAYGDVNAAGVGTATSVCQGEVVGFGHPLTFAGQTTLSLHPADAVYVQEDPLGPGFKVANLGDPVGTISEDHLTGITGSFGALPATTDITSSVTFADRSRTGTTHVALPEANAQMTFLTLLGNHDSVVDAATDGSEKQTWTITGTDADGSAFALDYTDRYVSERDITFDSVFDVANVVYALSRLEGVAVDRVDISSAVTTDDDALHIDKVEQRVGGEWTALDRRHRGTVAAGRTLVLRVTMLSETGAKHTTQLALPVPARAAGSRAYLDVRGASRSYDRVPTKRGLDVLVEAVESSPRNDQVVAELDIFKRRLDLEVGDVSGAQDLVVSGRQSSVVRVR